MSRYILGLISCISLPEKGSSWWRLYVSTFRHPNEDSLNVPTNGNFSLDKVNFDFKIICGRGTVICLVVLVNSLVKKLATSELERTLIFRTNDVPPHGRESRGRLGRVNIVVTSKYLRESILAFHSGEFRVKRVFFTREQLIIIHCCALQPQFFVRRDACCEWYCLFSPLVSPLNAVNEQKQSL